MRTLLASISPWVLMLVLFAVFLTVAFTCREIVIRRCKKKRRKELAEQATKLLTGVAAAFAFFVGFSITITWGAVAAGQSAVENEAAQAQQVIWTFNNTPDRETAGKILDQLETYLRTAADEDEPYLQKGDVNNLPSAKPLDRLQDSIHRYAYGSEVPGAEVSSIVSSAASMNTAAALVSAEAQRSLPVLLAVLLLVSGLLLAAITGISNAAVKRPILLPVWCLIPALSIAVIPGPGGIAVDLSPLGLVAERLAQGW
jgi:hypothetical protein